MGASGILNENRDGTDHVVIGKYQHGLRPYDGGLRACLQFLGRLREPGLNPVGIETIHTNQDLIVGRFDLTSVGIDVRQGVST